MVFENELSEILKLLESLEKRKLVDEVSIDWLAQVTVGNEIRISGNEGGLVNLARSIISLALMSSKAAHFHLDEYSGMDSCDQSIVISKQDAPWDKAHDT